MIGRELAYHPDVGFFNRVYYRLLGNPELGVRIRFYYFRRAIASLDLKGKCILDAGCGWGGFSLYLARRFPDAEIDSCDMAPVTDHQAIAQRMGLRNINFFQQDLTLLDAVDAYDFILCIDVLEHIPDDRRVLANFYKALRPGGKLYLHTPSNDFRTLLRFRSMDAKRLFPEHVRVGYSKAEMREKLTDVSFRVLKAEATWHWWAELLWEVGGPATKKAIRAFTVPLLLPLLPLDPLLSGQRGNGVLVLAQKKEQG